MNNIINFKNMDKKLLFIVIISIIATFNAGYLTYMAYTTVWVENAIYACDVNEIFSCSSVFNEKFAWIFGVPFSLIALFVYPIIVLVALLWLFKKIKSHYKIILLMSIWWVLFNSYIIYNEVLVATYCLLCLMCTVIIVINWSLSIKWLREKNN